VYFWIISKLKTHIANVPAVDCIGTECAIDNDTAENSGTILVADDWEIRPLKIHRKWAGYEM